MQNTTIEQEIQRLIAHMNEQHEQEPETDANTSEEKEPESAAPGQDEVQEVQDIYVLVVRESVDTDDPPEHIIETTLAPTKTETREPIDPLMYATGSFFLFLLLSSIAFQLSLVFNPPIVTVTLVPRSQVVTLTGTLQLGRVLQPLTLSQSQTTPTTGKGHQDAKQARGFITFYNGLFTFQTIAAGTILTGSDGIQVVTDQQADISAGNPPSYGQVTVSAHAINSGVRGNIPAYDINQACCSNAILAKNTNPFMGGQDERNFQTVAKANISSVATPLKTAVAQGMQAAFQTERNQAEDIYILPCTPTVTSDHQIGQEATQVKVTVSETCSGVVYNREEFRAKVTALLTSQAATKIGTGYSLFGEIQTMITQTTATHTSPPLVFLAFHAQGTWIYTLSPTAQQQMKHLIAGKSRREAITLLLAMPGIETATVEGDDQTKLPKSLDALHLSIIVPTS
jgi:hypothetical protein